MDKILIHKYHNVYFDPSSETLKHGMKYLENNLSLEEVKPFFHEAKQHGKAHFEDNMNNSFVLEYHDLQYTLKKRYE